MAFLLLFVMLLAGLNYQNSLALLLCFQLAGFALVTMYECHGSLNGLTISSARVESAFAHGYGELQLGFYNAGSTTRRSLRVRATDVAPKFFEARAPKRLPGERALPGIDARAPAHRSPADLERRAARAVSRLDLAASAARGDVYPAPVRPAARCRRGSGTAAAAASANAA